MNFLIKQLQKSVGVDQAGVNPRWRTERMHDMVRLLKLPEGARIIDLGGSENNWKLINHSYHITLVNLPGFNPPVSDPSSFDSIEGNACDLKDRFGDRSFDLAFSNSVIEHVGPEPQQAKFAEEARRLASAYWIQTPSPIFPVEAHTRVLFYWNRSQKNRDALLDRWSVKSPGWVEMLRETRVLSAKRMRELFPDGQLYRESRFGIEKSNTMYRPFTAH